MSRVRSVDVLKKLLRARRAEVGVCLNKGFRGSRNRRIADEKHMMYDKNN